jgi:hypothetical protein
MERGGSDRQMTLLQKIAKDHFAKVKVKTSSGRSLCQQRFLKPN